MDETLTKAPPRSAHPRAKTAPSPGGVSLGRLLRIDIRLEARGFITFVLLTFSFSGILGAAHPELRSGGLS